MPTSGEKSAKSPSVGAAGAHAFAGVDDGARKVRARRLPAKRELASCWPTMWESVGAALGELFVEVLRRRGPEDRAPLDRLRGRAPMFAAEYQHALHKEFEAALDEFVAPSGAARAKTRVALRLIGFEEQEFGTLVDRASARIRNATDEIYGPLKLRVAGMSGEVDIRDGEFPFRPGIFCRAAYFAMEKLDIDAQDRLRLLVRFDQPLIALVSAAYMAVDKYLSAKGHAANSPFDGDARSVMMRRLRRSATARVEQSVSDRSRYDGEPGSVRGRVDAEEILEALYARLQIAGVVPERAAGESEPSRQPAAAESPDEPSDTDFAVVDALTKGLDAEAAEAAPPDPALIEAINGVQQLSALSPSGEAGAKVDTTALREKIAAAATRPVDKLTVEIVGLLFDRIEHDRHLPAPIKTLVSRLQFPLIKAALADPELFVAADRPARRLIDRISSTAIGWSPEGEENQRYLEQVRRAIDTVLASNDREGEAFQRALAQMESYLTEERTTEQDPVARAKRALEEAETREVMAINATIKIRSAFDGAYIDPYLREFLLDPWVRVLVAAALRPPGGRKAADRFLAAVSDLIWSVQPKVDLEERRRMLKTIPATLALLREGLALIDFPPAKAEEFFGNLLASHAHAVRGLELAHGTPGAMLEAQAIRDKLKDLTLDGAALLPEASTDIHVSDDVVRQVLAERQVEVSHIGVPPLTGPRDPDLSDAQLDDFIHSWRPGDWFTLQLGDRLARVRLRWISPQKTLYLFTSDDGVHSHSLAPEAIRARLRNGDLLPAEPAPLFERAVQGVMVELQGAVDTMPAPTV